MKWTPEKVEAACARARRRGHSEESVRIVREALMRACERQRQAAQEVGR